MIKLNDMLFSRGLDKSARIKFVRHQDRRFDLDRLELADLEVYQSYQSKTVFNCDYIVSFIGLENSHAKFVGVYQVRSCQPSASRPLDPDYAHPNFFLPNGYFYELERLARFEDLAGRVVIDWGSSPLAWHQWLNEKDKEVVEVLPAGYIREFPGYLDFVLRFQELSAIVKNPAANRDWHRMLSAVAGVYLIVDSLTGKQYVGSAAGEGGIFSRWAAYVESGHGGNKQLVDLVGAALDYARNFNFTVLHTLSRSLPLAEVLKYESLYKMKLGSRAFGLNSN